MSEIGFLFDMDGTLVDNMMVHHRAWQLHLKDLGIDMSLEEVRQEIHGVNSEIMHRLFGDRFSDLEIEELAYNKEAKYREVFKGKVELLPGVKEFLEQANQRDIPMAIGTAAPPENVQFFFEEMPIQNLFQGIVHAGDVSKGKPNPEVYLKAAQSIGVPAEKCIVFEDSPTGAGAAFNAGAKSVILLTTHYEEEFKQYPNIIQFANDFNDLDMDELLSKASQKA